MVPTIQTKDRLVGAAHFKRENPMSDRFGVEKFHHIEYYCGDANSTYRRWSVGLGMELVAKSDNSTGNSKYASYVLRSRDLVFVFTAPYGQPEASGGGGGDAAGSSVPHPAFDRNEANKFFADHGLAVKAVGLQVDDAAVAYEKAVANGAVGVLAPKDVGENVVMAEIKLYGDVVLRFVSGDLGGPFLPGYVAAGPASQAPPGAAPVDRTYGLERLDHCVGNVPDMLAAYNYLVSATGFHEFAEFTAEDVGTVDSGLNSIVAASNNEMVLFPINEPTFGTKRKSQIQTYLEQNGGGGVQHLALKTDDIFRTLRAMRKMEDTVGFELMPRPSDKYYKELRAKVGDKLTEKEYAQCEELGILVDKDDQGILLQVFTKPVGDRPTLFLEVIQRIGCLREERKSNGEVHKKQAGGCGGFGKGNFKELFKSVEEYESTLDV